MVDTGGSDLDASVSRVADVDPSSSEASSTVSLRGRRSRLLTQAAAALLVALIAAVGLSVRPIPYREMIQFGVGSLHGVLATSTSLTICSRHPLAGLGRHVALSHTGYYAGRGWKFEYSRADLTI